MTAADKVTPTALLSASLRLTAVPTAVAVSRMFVRHTLTRWRFDGHVENATLIMSELVTNAVKAGGITEGHPKSWQITAQHVIGIQLRAVESSLYVEVWDRSDGNPVRKNPSLDATNGRGLLLVDALAKRRGIYYPQVGGKVVWAELPLSAPVVSPLSDQAHAPLRVPPDIRASRGPDDAQAQSALLDRLLTTTLEASVAAGVNGAT
ncbi:ATP-binding protein [Streptomyces sp. NPDC048341]|uniref:ATP-binding protein n=1 Tax=Streptomyces sp. NPDC048341 TaxID=3154620 RepID=UPI00341DB7A3